MTTEDIFHFLEKKGYKHYLPYTIKELSHLDFNSQEIIVETALIMDWLMTKHNIYISVDCVSGDWYYLLYYNNMHETKKLYQSKNYISDYNHANRSAITYIIKNIL